MLEFLRAYSPATLVQGSRTTVLNSLGWMAALLISALLGSSYAKNPDWITTMFAYGFGADLLLFLAAFVYFALKSPDALRSERYSIQKLALERGLIGDSASGLFLPDEIIRATQDNGVKEVKNAKQIEQQK